MIKSLVKRQSVSGGKMLESKQEGEPVIRKIRILPKVKSKATAQLQKIKAAHVERLLDRETV